jgi:light-regulated signal transduction histidine kinase (bacteriophytochrome)
VDVTVEDGLVARTDPALADIVLENLIGNAWKFTAGRPAAHIWVGVTPDRASDRGAPREFYVRDDGAGFDQNYVDRLFAPFQRLHTAEQFPGTGIGLATVARVLGRLGGTWRAEGQIGEGATFFFTLGAGDSGE